MAEITTNLTVAWLEAFARVRAQKSLLDTIEQETPRAGSAQTLTNVIENALRAAGEERGVEPAGGTAQTLSAEPGVDHLVDRLA